MERQWLVSRHGFFAMRQVCAGNPAASIRVQARLKVSWGVHPIVHRVQNGHFSWWIFLNIETKKLINPGSKRTLK